MPVNKFGRYLDEAHHSTLFGDKLEVDTINCEGKRLEHVRKGYYKDDALNKGQLDDAINLCLTKIKTVNAEIKSQDNRIQKLEARFTAPLSLPPSSKPSDTVLRVPLLPASKPTPTPKKETRLPTSIPKPSPDYKKT